KTQNKTTLQRGTKNNCKYLINNRHFDRFAEIQGLQNRNMKNMVHGIGPVIRIDKLVHITEFQPGFLIVKNPERGQETVLIEYIFIDIRGSYVQENFVL